MAKDIWAKTIEDLSAKLGGNVIMNLEDSKADTFDPIPSGVLALDAALGIGGIPRKRITQVAGWEDTGKTTLGLRFAASALEFTKLISGRVAYIDTEGKVSPSWIRTQVADFGVDTTNLTILRHNIAEDVMEMVKTFLPHCEAIVVDSIGNLVTRSQASNDVGSTTPAELARTLGIALPQISGPIEAGNCAVFFTNQLTTLLPLFPGHKPKPKPKGGRRLAYSLTFDFRVRRGQSKDKDNVKVLCDITKNHACLGPFQRGCEWTIVPGSGIDRIEDVFNAGLVVGTMVKAGSMCRPGWLEKDEEGYFSLPAQKALDHLKENKDGIFVELERRTLEALAGLRDDAYNGRLEQGGERIHEDE